LIDIGFQIYVEVSSDGDVLYEQEFVRHPTDDPNTSKPFWVSAFHLGGDIPGEGRSAVDFAPGEYTYKFVAKNKNGQSIDVWVPKNDKFTIIDGSQNN
jgi:hypothetical protein